MREPRPRPDPDRSGRSVVLLLNLGTPDAPDARAVRRYLAEFLSDPRVIEYPRWLWWPLLRGVILPLRAPRSAHAYRRVWTAAGSPLLVQSQALAEALAGALGPELEVVLAMRYGRPGIPEVLRAVARGGTLRRLLLLPLYPQYSATTTATAFDAVAAELRRWRRLPELRMIADYHDDPRWIEAVAGRIAAYWQEHGRGDRLLLSFHGLPARYTAAGDPYARQCEAGARAIAARLGLADGDWCLSYQSRVGREAWLQPYTEDSVRRLGAEGVQRLDVACPGFAVDCLETLEEIALQNAEFFREAGGGALHYIPCLNDDPAHVAALAALVRRHACGWPGAADPACTS